MHMLRSKQVIPFCKGARSVIIPGVRNNSVDGSAPSTEDDGTASKSHLDSSKDCGTKKYHSVPLYRLYSNNDALRSSFVADSNQHSIHNAIVEPDPSTARTDVKGQQSEKRSTIQNFTEMVPSCIPNIDNACIGSLKPVNKYAVSRAPRQAKDAGSNNRVGESKKVAAYSSLGSHPVVHADNGFFRKKDTSGVPDRTSAVQGPPQGNVKFSLKPIEGTVPFQPNYLYDTQRKEKVSSLADDPSNMNSRRCHYTTTDHGKHCASEDAVFSSEINGHAYEEYPLFSGSDSMSCYHGRDNGLQNIYGNPGNSKNVPCDSLNVSVNSNKVPCGSVDLSVNDISKWAAGNSQKRVDKNHGGGFKKKSQGAFHSLSFAGNKNLVDRVTLILRQMHWGPATKEALGRLNASLNVYQVNQILKAQQDPYLALNFFNWSKQQIGFRHDEHSYTTMIGILGNARRFDLIDTLLDEMQRDGFRPTVVTYNRLIHCYGRANHLEKALEIFQDMQAAGCQPDRTTYGTLINIHAKAGFLDVAMQMYSEMQAAGLAPDSFVYSVMINCLGKSGDVSSAYKLFCEMIDRGCVPTLVTYNNVIDLHAKARKYGIVLKLYRQMRNAGFQPDKYTYNVVMEVHRHCGRYEEAEAVLYEMKKAGWTPDEVMYGLLVDMWGKAGNVDKASQWYKNMLNSGIRPNVPTCNSLLGAFLRVNMLDQAFRVLQEMLHMNLSPSLQTYTLLISSCTTTTTNHHHHHFSNLLANTGHPAHTFLLSLPAAEPGGQNIIEHASNFFEMMHSEDRESKRGFADALVNFLYTSDLKEEAGFVWEVAMDRNLYPNAVTLKAPKYWSINLHVMSMGTAVIALARSLARLRQTMLMSGIEPTRIDIITGWGRRSKIMGSSLVKQSVENVLSIFHSPFCLDSGNSGCFVGFGRPLIEWMQVSPLERMHLL